MNHDATPTYANLTIAKLERELADKTNEIAKLRELLNRAIEEIEWSSSYKHKLTAFTAHKLAEKYREELAQLTPAPEASSDKICKDCNQLYSRHTSHPYEPQCPETQIKAEECYGGLEPLQSTEGKFSCLNPAYSERCKVCGEEYGFHAGGDGEAICPKDTPSKNKEERPLFSLAEQMGAIAGAKTEQWRWCQVISIANKLEDEIRYLRDEIQRLRGSK
jgi:hypothetical protein